MNRPEIFDDKLPMMPSGARLLTIGEVVTIIRRQLKAILAITLLFAVCGGLYLSTARKLYTADATLLIDPRRVQLFRQDSVTSDLSFDSATLESQIETLRSDNIAIAVINNLGLWKDPEFIGEPPGPIGAAINAVRDLFDDTAPDTDENKKRRALDRFRSLLDVKRSGLSYAINLKFVSWSPAKAAAISNEIGEAYILDQIESRFELTQRASVWLQSRIKELQTRASDAERAVADFRFTNQIIDANGRLVTEQQLQEFSTQMSVARQGTQEAKARLDRLREITRSGLLDATVADALRNEIFIKLRGDYLELVRREADWSARFGPNHQQSVQLRGDMLRLQRSMQDELKRIEQTYQSDFEIARAREAATQQDMTQLMAKWAETRQAQLKLRELDSTATSFRTLHDTFVQRYLQAVQQQSFPISDARVISPAVAPRRASAPRSFVIGMASIVLGLCAGLAFALFRELGDVRVRTARDLKADTGVDCIGILPAAEGPEPKASTQTLPDAPLPSDGHVRHFTLPPSEVAMSRALRQPFSMYAETCRKVKVAIDVTRMTRPVRTVAIVSSSPGEGKTSTACNVGLAIARGGSRVLVIDCDLRKPKLTKTLLPDAQAGIVEVLLGQRDLQSVLWRESVSGCYFLPAVLTLKLSNSSDMLSSPSMERLLALAAEQFDYVFLDSAPIDPVSDVLASSHLIDGFVLLTAWGETKRETVVRAANAPFMRNKLLGTLLTKVDMRSYRLFETIDDSYYSYEYVRS